MDIVISEFTKLLTEYPSYYKEMSLPDTAHKMLVPIVQETLLMVVNINHKPSTYPAYILKFITKHRNRGLN